MAARHVLNEDWSTYDDRKNRLEDRLFFSCEEDWEMEYLIGKIIKTHPAVSRDAIREAMRACCLHVPAPRPRTKFVECVMSQLGY